MESQILEGTFAEVQQRLSALLLKPETRLRVIISESDTLNAPETEALAGMRGSNGFILLPASGLTTLEEVEEALYQADMEDALDTDWEQRIPFLQGSTSSAENKERI